MFKTKSYIIISFVLLYIANIQSVYSQISDTVIINNSHEPILLGNYLYFLEDKENSLSIEDILTPQYQEKFQPNKRNVFSKPASSSGYWFKICIKNQTHENLYLEIGTTYAWYIDFYQPDSTGTYKLTSQTGSLRPNSTKYFDINLFWLPINTAQNAESTTYYVFVKNGLPYEVPIQAGTIEALYQYKTKNDILTGAFLGLILIMFLYNTFLYISIRDKVYIYYLGYLLWMFVSMPFANGYPFIQELEIGFINQLFWHEYFLFWHPFVYMFVGLFCINYLNLKERAPLFRVIILAFIIILSGIYPLLNLLGFPVYVLVNSYQIILLVFYITCWITGIYIAFKKFKTGYYYITAWTFMIGGAVIFFAVINGYLPFTPYTRNSLYFGIAIEVWMFSLALGNRLNTLMHEKAQIQAENIKILEQQNTLLESKVKERTTDLEDSNLRLIQTIEELNALNEELKLVNEQLDIQSTELSAINKTKDKIFAIISHDLRSPLGTIKNLLDLIIAKHADPQLFYDNLPAFKDSVEYIHFTLSNLLNWANSQMHGFKLSPEWIDIADLIQDNLNLTIYNIQEKNISIHVDVPTDLSFSTDKNNLNLLIRNFLGNAIKYTPKHGEIHIKARIIQEKLKIHIKDTGIGMSNEMISKILSNKEYQNSRYGTMGEKGTGIGLVLCVEVIAALKGTLQIHSEENKGTDIGFELPTL